MKKVKIAKKVKAEVLPATVELSREEQKVARLIKTKTGMVDAIQSHVNKEAGQLTSVLLEIGEALETVDQGRRRFVLDEAGIASGSSYRSTLNRISADPQAFKKAYLEVGNVNKAIALLPHQEGGEGNGRGKGGGRRKKSEKVRLQEKAEKAIWFLVQNYELKTVIEMVKEAAKELEDTTVEEVPEEVEA